MDSRLALPIFSRAEKALNFGQIILEDYRYQSQLALQSISSNKVAIKILVIAKSTPKLKGLR